MPKDNPSVGRTSFRCSVLKTLNLHLISVRFFAIATALLAANLLGANFGLSNTRTYAQTPNTTVNYQARILTAAGAVVPDGNYHIEFKIYDDISSGTTSQGSCTGNCLWMETRSTGNLVRVVDGYVSVNLGSVTAFPSSMPWSQNLYITMRVGGNGGSASWDTEMTNSGNRMKLNGAPLAYVANNVASSNTNAASTNSSNISIQSGNALGTTSNSGSITIDTGTATGTTGTITLGATNASGITLGRSGLTTSNAGALTVSQLLTANSGATIAGGSQFTNASSSLFSAMAIANLPTGGAIGTAAATVDVATTFSVNQTTASQTLTLPTPTTTTAGRLAFVNNVGSASFTMHGAVIAAGGSNAFMWNGSAWVTTVSLSGSVVNSVGTLDSQTKSADGAVISSNALYLQTADATYAGLVSTGSQTFAGAKTFNGGVILAASQSLTVTGGNTASRPGSPTEGMVYFDTDTDSLLTYANGKWQSDRGEYIIVAASDSTQAEKDAADYVTDGTSDETEINSALTEAAGGKVLLLAGTYVADGTILIPNNTTLAGVGRGTLVQLADIDATDNLIENSDTSTGVGVVIRDLQLDGQDSLQTSGTQYGIYLNGVGNGATLSGGSIQNVWAHDFENEAIRLNNSDNVSITESELVGNTQYAINIIGGSTANIISGNVIDSNASYGIRFDSSTNNTVTNNNFLSNTSASIYIGNSSNNNSFASNTISGSAYGMFIIGSTNTTISDNNIYNTGSRGVYNSSNSHNSVITGNTITTTSVGIDVSGSNYVTLNNNSITGATTYGVYVSGSNNAQISGNTLHDNGGGTTNQGIFIGNSSYASVTGNTITDTACTTSCYAIRIDDAFSYKNYLSNNRFSGSSSAAASISDVSTSTIYAGQQTNTSTSTNSDVTDFTFRGSANSANAFAVLNASGSNIFNVDTSTAGISVSGTASVSGNLTVDTSTLFVNATNDFVSVGSTSDLGARFQVVGANNETQLLVRANGTQSMSNPLVLLQNSSGSELARINATTSSLFFGNAAGGSSAAGVNNTGIGASALGSVSTGTGNTTLGSGALASVSVNNNNTAVGYNAGNLATGGNNIFLGALAGDNVTTGTDNIIIGYNLDASSSGATNELRIGGVLQGNTSTLAAQFNGTLAIASLGTADTSTYLCRNTSNIISGCLVSPLTSSLTDNVANALDIQEGTNNYININTTNSSENISFGNATTNPSYNFLGSGTLAVAGSQTIAGSLTVGSGAGVGLFTNNGATVNTTLAISNLATGGAIGTAAATVDIYTSFSVNQTTSGQTITIPTPTASTTYGRTIYIANIGTQSFTLLGNVVAPGNAVTAVWSNTNGGASWQTSGTAKSGGTAGTVSTAASGGASGAVASKNPYGADYINTSTTSAQTVINTALTNVGASGGGTVYLMEGTYIIDGAISIPNNTTLAGSVAGTVIKMKNGTNASVNMITNTDTTTGEQVILRDIILDGNQSNQSSGTMHGVYFTGLGSGTGSSTKMGATITNLTVKNMRSQGIYLDGSNNSSITNSKTFNNTGNGIIANNASRIIVSNNSSFGNSNIQLVYTIGDSSTIANNMVDNSATGIGVYFDTMTNSIVSSNTIFGSGTGTQGVYIGSSSRNIVTGNTIKDVTGPGIEMADADYSVISNNNIYNTGGTTTNSGISLTSSDYNEISDNLLTDSSCTISCTAIAVDGVKNSLKNNRFIGSATNAATLADSGTNTIYSGQQTNSTTSTNSDISDFRFRGSANSTTAFAIQNASAASLFNVDTTNGTVTINNSTGTANIFQVQDNGSNVLTVADGGNVTLTADLAVNGDDITSDSNLTVNATGYVRIGDTGTPGVANGDDDLYVEGDLEVDATVDITGNLTVDTNTLYVDATNNRVGIGATPNATLQLAGNQSAASFSTGGIAMRVSAATYTDTGTAASGTQTIAVGTSFGVPTFAATNSNVTYTNAATLYISAAPSAGTNVTITNPYALYIASGNSIFGGDITTSTNLQVNGNTTLGNATTDRLTVTAQLLGGSPLAFQGATDNGFATTLAVTEPTANNTITLPDQSGTVLLGATGTGNAIVQVPTSNTASAQGANVIAPTTNSVVGLKVSRTTGTATNAIQVNTATVADTTAQILVSTGATTQKGLVIQRVASQTANPLEVQNESGTPIAYVAASGNIITEGEFISQYSVRSSDGTGASSSFTVRSGNTTGGSGLSTGSLTLQSGNGSGTNTSSGNVIIDAGSKSGSGTAGQVLIATTNATSVLLGRAGILTANQGSMSVAQDFIVDTNTFVVDSTNDKVGIGTTSPTGASRLVVTGTPSGTENTLALFTSSSTATSGSYTGLINELTVSAASSSTAGHVGGSFDLITAGTQQVNDITALQGYLEFGGTSSVNNAVGVGSWAASYSGSASVTRYSAFAAPDHQGGSATIANNVGLNLEDRVSGTNNVNININDDVYTSPAGNWSIYNASTYDNYFAGNLGIGQSSSATIDANTLVVNNQATTDNILLLQDNGTNVLVVADGGNATFSGNVSVSANYSLTLNGGATGTRPASPTEGMIYYDTTTKQLLVYANGKWQTDRTDAILVAASNSSQTDKDIADYVGDGNTVTANDGDQVQINNALTAASGRKVVLLAGTYTVDATILVPNNTTFMGVGNGTVVEFADIDATDYMIENSDTSTGTGVVIRDMKLDGRSDLNTGTQRAIYLNGLGNGTGTGTVMGGQVKNLTITRFNSEHIYLNNSDNNEISGNTSYNANGAIVLASSNNNTMTNNIMSFIQGVSAGGIIMTSSNYNVIDGNSITSSVLTGSLGYGLSDNGTNNIITNNSITTSLAIGSVRLTGTNSYTVFSGNFIGSDATTFTGTYINATNNTFSGSVTISGNNNTMSDNKVAGSITNSGSNTSITGNSVTISINASSGTYVNIENNTVSAASGTAITVGSSNGSITGNTIITPTTTGISVTGANNTVSSNTITNSGGATANNGLSISGDDNIVSANIVSDTSNSTTCNAIVINSGADRTYISSNKLIGCTAAMPPVISDSGTNTTQSAQITRANSSLTTSSILRSKGSLIITGSIDPAASTTVTGVGTSFTTELEVGDRILVSGETRTITTISSDTSLTVDVAFSNNANDTSVDRLAASLLVRNSSNTNTIIVDSDGAATFRNSTNSTTAFSVQNSSGTSILSVDTTNSRVGINTSSPSADLSFGDGANRTINVIARTTAGTGYNLTVAAGQGNGANTGGALNLNGGAAGAANANGGNVVIAGGAGAGSGVSGLVVISNPTFQTATVQNFTSSGTITQANVDSNGAILISSNAAGYTATLGDPTITTAGRVVYVTNSGTFDMTLSVNGGGSGNTITLKPATTATMIWNGSDWTAAGASSSTDLQAAYNNTATSAGGAELILNAPGGSADGLTIRNNGTSPIIGGLLEVQSSIGSNLFTVNNNATEYANNGGAESSTFTMWTGAFAGGTVARDTTSTNVATGQGSVSVVTTATGHGAENTLTTTLTPNLKYAVAYTVKGTSNFSTLETVYSRDGTNTSTTSCNSAQTVTTSQFTRISCTFTAPSSGITASNSIFIRQTDATGRTFYIDNLSVTVSADVNHAADGSVDLALGTNWTDFGANTSGTTAAVRNTTVLYDTSGSVEKTTGATADRGIINNLTISPAVSTQYLVTFYARSSNTFNDIRVRYSRDGGTNFVSCTDYNTQAVSTTAYTRITCIFTTDGTTATNPDLVIDQPTATARTFYVDALTVSLNTNNSNNVQIGGGSRGGPTTLFTLDRSSGAPIAANNDAYLGSMYYDTSTGRIQCYEADGWGACGAAPDNIVNLNPEYAGAVLNGSGVGTMTADFCGNGGGLSTNTSLCASGESRNFYRWTSPQATQQTYSIYVTYQLPTTFNGFSSDDTIQLTGRVDSTTNAAVTYEVFRSTGSTITQCGTGETNVITTPTGSAGVAGTWYSYGINGNESTGCGFNSSAAGNFVIFKINLKANSNANAYVSTLSFTTTGR